MIIDTLSIIIGRCSWMGEDWINDPNNMLEEVYNVLSNISGFAFDGISIQGRYGDKFALIIDNPTVNSIRFLSAAMAAKLDLDIRAALNNLIDFTYFDVIITCTRNDGQAGTA